MRLDAPEVIDIAEAVLDKVQPQSFFLAFKPEQFGIELLIPDQERCVMGILDKVFVLLAHVFLGYLTMRATRSST